MFLFLHHAHDLLYSFSIAPWNAPVALTMRAVAVPLLCGNTVVLKSSEYSPRSQALVVELFQEAGVPAGVLNFISISRENAPALTAEIIAHPLVRNINVSSTLFGLQFTNSFFFPSVHRQ